MRKTRLLRAASASELNIAWLSIWPVKLTPNKASTSQFFFHSFLRYGKLVNELCMTPSHVAVSTLSSKLSKSSSSLTTTSLRLQNCISLSIISPQGFVPCINGAYLLGGALLCAASRLNIPLSPVPDRAKEPHSFKKSAAEGFSRYTALLFAIARLMGNGQSLAWRISLSWRSDKEICELRLTPPTTTISAIWLHISWHSRVVSCLPCALCMVSRIKSCNLINGCGPEALPPIVISLAPSKRIAE